MQKETIEIDDIREVVKLIEKYRPNIKYFTQYEYHHAYSQTNETSLDLIKVNDDVDENSFDEGVENIDNGDYDSSKKCYNNDVYECEINLLKLDLFIDLLNHYIEIKGNDCDDWSCDNFFEWFHPLDGDYPETELRNQIFDNDKWNFTLGYSEFVNHDITWCCGFNNFRYHGIKIENIETNNMIYSFSGFWNDYNGEEIT